MRTFDAERQTIVNLEIDMDRLLLAFALIGVVACNSKTLTTGKAPEPTPVVLDSTPKDYDEPFGKATLDEVGPDQLPPVDRTIGGKSTAQVREAVERLWPTIKLVGDDQKPTPWVVTLETEAGNIEISLRPDLAPNHVRNFIALTKAGYYDGLFFDRLVHQEAESPDGAKSEIRLVRFGCPAGTGNPGIGHIGYRLRSEFSDEKHVAGTVGFTRDADPSSAGVRLYITLAPTPILDGSYTVVGKVSKGMDAVEKIAAGKLLTEDIDPTRELPAQPVVIRKATAK
jgi:peptidylprolyl isomerase